MFTTYNILNTYTGLQLYLFIFNVLKNCTWNFDLLIYILWALIPPQTLKKYLVLQNELLPLIVICNV